MKTESHAYCRGALIAAQLMLVVASGAWASVTDVSPNTGPTAGGTAVTISGSGFSMGSSGNAVELWNVTSNPTTSENPPGGVIDGVRDVVVDDSFIYVVGHDSVVGNMQWRIEKRDKTTGQLVAAFGSGGAVQTNPSGAYDSAEALDLDDSSLYVAGYQYSAGYAQWRIEKRDKTTGALIPAFGGSGFFGGYTSGRPSPPDGGGCTAIEADGSDVYIVGQEFPAGRYYWRVERRDKTSGALNSAFDGDGVLSIDVGGYYQFLNSVQVDGSAIYLGGSDDGCGQYSHEWRIEKRDRNTGALIGGFAGGGVFRFVSCNGSYGYGEDISEMFLDGGFLFAVGPDGTVSGPDYPQWRIGKFDASTGALAGGFGSGGYVLVNPSGAADVPYSVWVLDDKLFVSGMDRATGNSQWRVEARDTTTGSPVSGFGTGGVFQSNYGSGEDNAEAVVADAQNLYLVGAETGPGNYQWRMIAYGFAGPPTVTFDGVPATDVNFIDETMLTAVTPAHAAGAVDVTVTNLGGSPATLTDGYTYCDEPVIDVQPGDDTVCTGDSPTLSIVASGSEPFVYQWRKDGLDVVDGGNIFGATTASLFIDPATEADEGEYDVVVTNSCGTAISDAAPIVVLAGPDCNTNSVPDECEVYAGDADDCNGNYVPDECDVAEGGSSSDCDTDGVPDDCQPNSGEYRWIGPHDGYFLEPSHWDSGESPGYLAHAVLTNSTTDDNRAVIPSGADVCSILLEGPGGGRQILQIFDPTSPTSTINGFEILAGGELDLQGGDILGGALTIVDGAVTGFGRISTDVINEGRIDPLVLERLTLAGEIFENRAAGLLRAPAAAGVHVRAASLTQAGSLEIRGLAAQVFDALLTNGAGGRIELLGGLLDADGVQNQSDAEIYGTGTIDSDVDNDGLITIIADMLVVGDLNNNGTIYIQNGVLTVTGDMSGTGTILGGFGG